MSRITDEKIDQIARKLLDDLRLSDETLDEIADAPQLWWAVRAAIAEKPPARAGWFRLFDWRLIPAAAVLLAAILGLASLGTGDGALAVSAPGPRPAVQIARLEPEPRPAAPVKSVAAGVVPADAVKRRPADRRAPRSAAEKRVVRREVPSAAEVKSEFIALMYSSDQDSGQLVKVRVPRSMMVSLGVSSDTGSGSELVDAEILMGNDGSARAIRFVR